MRDGRPGLRSFVRELRRRGVFRVAVLYVVVGFGIIEAADLLFPRLGLPEGAVQLVVGLAIVGLPVALTMAWAFELTPERKRPRPGAGVPEAERSEGEVSPGPPTPPPTPTDRERLLVLPFENISPDEENRYVADGLTDEIIAGLSRLRALGVISRTSSMRLKGTDKDVRTLGRELGVRYVLEGSVRKAGADLRITAQLVDAGTDQHVWAETYQGSVDEVFEIQQGVARSIARALRIELSPADERELARRRIDDPVAHESYLRARHEMWSFSREGVEKARRHILNAIDLVGDNELLLAALGHIHVWFLQTGTDLDSAHLHEAEACADAIFALDSNSRHGYRLRGLIEFQRGDLRAARPWLETSFEREPDDPDTLATLGYVNSLVGREDLALPLFERLLALDPLTPLNHAMPGFVAVLEGRFADAVAPYETFLRMDDGGPFSLMNWVWILGLNSRIDETEPTVATLRERYPDTPYTSTAASLFHALRGERERALAAISPALREAGRRNEMFARFLMECHALAGDVRAALAWLETDIDLGMANYPFLARIDPLIESLRGERRFESIMERVETEWRSFQD